MSIIFSGTGSNSNYGVIFANSAGYGLGYYASGYVCLPCDSSCLSCIGGTDGNCTSCNTTSTLRYYTYFSSNL